MLARSKKVAAAILKAVKAEGFNTYINTRPAAGQVVFHTHMHIIPRFPGDGFRHWPGKKATPDELRTVQEQIRQHLT
jgi:histidine triad (HIT) family protein